ncbi:MAG: hypothetical protein HON70_04365 [Lentisphaerae bacterium]|nr:hypothetical protein [Lentisphaerota bacterium]
MKRRVAHTALGILTIAVSVSAAPVKVCVFAGGLGAKAVQQALSAEPELSADVFKTLDVETIVAFDAITIGATSIDQPAQVKALKIYLACGGGVVFNHHSCGRRKPTTLFPEIAVKVVDRREDTALVVQDSSHPIAAGLPERFRHAYNDHLHLTPGPQGSVIIVDAEAAPVTIAGGVDAGRVVFNGGLPGYRYDPVSFAQGEAKPEGAELRLLVNSLMWAAAGRATTLDAGRIAASRNRVEKELKLADLENLLPSADWFGTEMLTGNYLPARPVNELGGRFFITYDNMTWRGYDMRTVANERELAFYRNRQRMDVCYLKWLGVTDIMYWTDVSGHRVNRPTDVPDSAIRVSGFDPLAELIRAATAEGLNVWAAWHSCFRDTTKEDVASKYCAKNARGELYKYGRRDLCEDLLSPAYRERVHRFIDEYAAKYKPMGNFMGLGTYDEIWFTYADYHGDDFELFAAFCREEFGEEPTGEVTRRFSQVRDWKEPGDVWRSRYILFKQKVVTDFYRDLIGYVHGAGMKIGLGLPAATSHYSSGWLWGIDGVELLRLKPDFAITGASENALSSYPQILRWSHVGNSWGYYNTHCTHGGPGGIFFTFNQLWRPIMYGNNLHLARELGRHIHVGRQWADAQVLARVALLHNQNSVQMLLADARDQVRSDRALLAALQRTQDAEMVFTQAVEQHSRYRAFIAPPFAVRGIPDTVYAHLKTTVENGGVIISVNSDWSTARRDLTREQTRTAETVGVTYGAEQAASTTLTYADITVDIPAGTPRRSITLGNGVEVMAAFADGTPAITAKRHGEGTVIGLHFDAGTELETNTNLPLTQLLSALVRQLSHPEILLKDDVCGIVTSLRKGDWAMVALYSEDVPIETRLSIDTEALGLRSDAGFRLWMLGKRLEINRPGEMWGETGYWTPEELRDGFRVTVVRDSEADMPLPESFDFSDFEGKRKEKFATGYINKVGRDWWNSENRGKRKRDYSHEIVVIAPADEPVMPTAVAD